MYSKCAASVAGVLSENEFLSQLSFYLRLRLKIAPMKGFVSWFLFFVSTVGFVSGQQADYEDYWAMLGEDDIQGLKHGFLARPKIGLKWCSATIRSAKPNNKHENHRWHWARPLPDVALMAVATAQQLLQQQHQTGQWRGDPHKPISSSSTVVW